MSSIPPGWYPDPTNPLQERLWDGDEWIEKTRMIKPIVSEKVDLDSVEHPGGGFLGKVHAATEPSAASPTMRLLGFALLWVSIFLAMKWWDSHGYPTTAVEVRDRWLGPGVNPGGIAKLVGFPIFFLAVTLVVRTGQAFHRVQLAVFGRVSERWRVRTRVLTVGVLWTAWILATRGLYAGGVFPGPEESYTYVAMTAVALWYFSLLGVTVVSVSAVGAILHYARHRG